MPPTIGVAGCKTLTAELKRCCEELGLPSEMYGSRPCCLFGEERGKLCGVVGCAAENHDDLLLAFGGGCADVDDLRASYGGASLTAHKCSEMLVGAGTYGWCVGQGVLLLAPTWFDEYVSDAETRGPLEEVLKSQVDSSGASRIGAIHEAARPTPASGLADIAGITERPTTPIFSGLGHLREAVRAAAVAAGIKIAQDGRAPIGIDAIGPGDQLLLMDDRGSEKSTAAATLAATLLGRGISCVWITNGKDQESVVAKIGDACSGVEAMRDSGQLRVLTGEDALSAAGGGDDPRYLARRWITLALQALAEGRSGLCVIHGDGWAQSAGLDVDYLLEYTARLSAACARWPLASATDVSSCETPDSVLGELVRTHPLIWTGGHIIAGAQFDPDYLGGTDALESLESGSQKVDCQAVAPLISAMADGELNGSSRGRLEEHTSACPRCQALAKRNRGTRDALGGLRQAPTEAAPGLWERIAAEISSE